MWRLTPAKKSGLFGMLCWCLSLVMVICRTSVAFGEELEFSGPFAAGVGADGVCSSMSIRFTMCEAALSQGCLVGVGLKSISRAVGGGGRFCQVFP